MDFWPFDMVRPPCWHPQSTIEDDVFFNLNLGDKNDVKLRLAASLEAHPKVGGASMVMEVEKSQTRPTRPRFTVHPDTVSWGRNGIRKPKKLMAGSGGKKGGKVWFGRFGRRGWIFAVN